MPVWTYKYLDHLPKIPDHFLTNYEARFNNLAFEFTDQEVVWKGQPAMVTNYRRYHITDEFLAWVKTNIVGEAIDFSLAYHNYTCDRPSQFPHVDKTRHYTLIYLLDLGGDNVITTFYNEPGKPTVTVEPTPSSELCKRYDTLIPFDSTKFELGRWVILNSKIIHGIEGMDTCRKSVQISLDKDNELTSNNCAFTMSGGHYKK